MKEINKIIDKLDECSNLLYHIIDDEEDPDKLEELENISSSIQTAARDLEDLYD